MQARSHAVFAAFSIENTRENTPETRFRTGTSYIQKLSPQVVIETMQRRTWGGAPTA